MPFGALMTHIARIEQELDSFPDTLSLYREQLKHWFSRAADQASRAADLPSLMGMERIIRFGNTTTTVSSGDDEFLSSVAQCPEGGMLEIESKFESVYDIPLGNISVDVIAMDGGESTPVTLDENGKGTVRRDTLASSTAFMFRAKLLRLKSKTFSPLMTA